MLSLKQPTASVTTPQTATRTGASPWGQRFASAALVASLLISLVGYAWWNSSSPDEPFQNLAYAPQVSPATGEEVLTPATAPWIADFQHEDCTQTSGLLDVTIDYQAMPEGEPQHYAVQGVADAGSAEAAAAQYGAMRGCTTLTSAWAYWSEARTFEHQRVLTDTARTELAELQSYFAERYPEQFMAMANDITVDGAIQAEWAARADAGLLGNPIPLPAKINPEWGVTLADGRIAFPATIIYAANDPAIVQNGLPVNHPAGTVVMIFTHEDGAWKYDDSLALCIVDCAGGIGNPINPNETIWTQPMDERVCRAQPMIPNLSYSVGDTMPEYADRRYQPSLATPDAHDVERVTDTASTWLACTTEESNSNESRSYMTPLGMTNLVLVEEGGFGDPFVIAPYLRQRESEAARLLTSVPNWSQLAIADTHIRYNTNGMIWSPMYSGTSENVAVVRSMELGFNPNTVVELSDGRMAIASTPTISIYNRGAITYEGDQANSTMIGVILQRHDSQWLVDEVIVAPWPATRVLTHQPEGWWWNPAFDPTPEATPKP